MPEFLLHCSPFALPERSIIISDKLVGHPPNWNNGKFIRCLRLESACTTVTSFEFRTLTCMGLVNPPGRKSMCVPAALSTWIVSYGCPSIADG